MAKLIPPKLNTIYCGDAKVQLGRLEPGFADTIVTSPPYFRHRNYATANQVGQERTPEEYIERLVALFRAARQSLHDHGTLWLVLGDKYQAKRLLGMPWRVALALQEDGWYLRSDIIWQKPNAMPSAVKNRPTTDHEYVFLLSKGESYYYDIDAIREPHVTFSENSRMKGGRNHFFKRDSTPENGKNGGHPNLHNGRWDQAFHPKGRNKRTVWSIPLSKVREAHFAVFPESLVETCVLAGCPDQGVVLDPFMGSGTTAIVSQRLNRNFVGIECVQDYCKMARKRIKRAKQDESSKPN